MIGGAVVGLAVAGYVAGAGVSNWLAWVNEPLAQQRSAFSLAFAPAVQVPAVGAQSGQATATAVAPPPTVSAAARAAANATPTPPAASTAGRTGAPGATAVATAARTAGNTVPASNAATATVTARSAATPAAGSTAQATAADSALGNRRRIVNTDGAGVALRSGPDGDRLRGKGYDEGVNVTVLERSGPWTHIRGDDGRDGWIPTVTLTP